MYINNYDGVKLINILFSEGGMRNGVKREEVDIPAYMHTCKRNIVYFGVTLVFFLMKQESR